MLIQLALLALAGLTGLATGALMNARVARSPGGQAVLSRRACSVCAHPVAVADMVPIVGHMRLRGQCRRCRAVVPWHYALAEIAVGLLFVIFAARILFGFWIPEYVSSSEYFLLFVRDALMSVFLVYIFMFDALASVIPDRLSLTAIGIALVCNLMLGVPATQVLLGALLIASFFAFQTLASAGKWVGGGDVRVGFLMGALLGPWIGVATLVLSYILGALIGLHLLFFRRARMSDHVPFGTFMVIAMLIMMLWGEQILGWYFSLVPLS
jgi:prepilin signal peptidase PulO-like enzyme (type II secretory pathway)